MVQKLTPDTTPDIIYPDSDGQPMADNTKQLGWIVTIKENLYQFSIKIYLIFSEAPRTPRETKIASH